MPAALPGHAVSHHGRPDPRSQAAARRSRAAQQRQQLDLLAQLGRDRTAAAGARHRAGRAAGQLRAGLPHAAARARGGRSGAGDGRRRDRAVRPGQRTDASSFGRQLPDGPAAGRARRAVRAGLLGRRTLDENWDAHQGVDKNHELHCGETDQPIAALLTDLEAARPAGRDAGGVGRRVRPHADRPRATTSGRDHNPRGFTHVDGRRRHQGRRRPTARPTSSATRPSRTRSTSTTCTPRSCT